MQVRQEHDPKVRDVESGDAPVQDRRRGAPYDARTRIHEVGGLAYDDRGGRSGAVRVRSGRAGSEQHDLGKPWSRAAPRLSHEGQGEAHQGESGQRTESTVPLPHDSILESLGHELVVRPALPWLSSKWEEG
jgi:hypothetical protein